MKNYIIILLPIIFLMTFACVNEEPEVIMEDETLNSFLNSSFYSSLKEKGYQIDENLIEYKATENGIGYVAPIKAFPSTMRVVSTHAELVSVKKDKLDKDFKSFILTYENLTSEEEDYTGNITIYDYASNGESVIFEFEDGQLINDFGSSERALNNMGCSFRSTLACVGYRIEGMNWAERAFFFSSFGVSFGGEVASCLVDGCPYE